MIPVVRVKQLVVLKRSGEEGEGSGAQASNPTVNNPSGGKEGDTSKYRVVIGDLDIPVRSGFSMDAKIPLKTKNYLIMY